MGMVEKNSLVVDLLNGCLVVIDCWDSGSSAWIVVGRARREIRTEEERADREARCIGEKVEKD